MSFEYNKTSVEINNTNKYILQIEFDISRYGKYQNIMIFNNPVTEEEAIKKVEEYLSKLMNSITFNLFKDDLFETDSNNYNMIGDF